MWKSVEDMRFRGETYRWFFYKKLLECYDFRDKRILEIGCGTGINSIFMARAGADVTFLDSSREALQIVRKALDEFSLEGELVCENAFRHGFRNEFDLVHSEGVIEHFAGEYRQQILDSHSAAAKKGGKVAVIVPNMKCAPYRIGKFLSEKTGTWLYGNEYPYTQTELGRRLQKSGLDVERLQGAEFALSYGWLLSPFLQKSDFFLKKALSGRANITVARFNYGGNFLNTWGSVLGAVGRKR
jgi:2-polyprenyl-3-methyl-5-hydroxy-6-metoxy-1,4-benzoquinol methylase